MSDYFSLRLKNLLPLLALAVFAFASTPVFTLAVNEQVVINSNDWRDVYSGVLYAGLLGENSKFLIAEGHALILDRFLDSRLPVLAIESTGQPMSFGYVSLLTSKGFNVQKVSSENGASLAINLARRAGSKTFIVVGDSRGYDAMSVAPYALQTRSFVLFVNKDNVDEIAGFLSEANPLKVVLYGPHLQKTIQALSKFNPDRIDTGSRFTNNIEIVRRTVAIAPTTQIALTNGEFIEETLIKGGFPNLLVGKDLPPQPVVDYLRSSNFKIGTLIGNDLVGSATYLKENTPMKTIFIKFAQGWPEPGKTFNEVRDLDKFYLPKFDLNISIVLVQYNTGTKQLEVVYKNNVADQITFVKSSITLTSGGKTVGTVGDSIPFSIPGGEEATIVYDVDLTGAISSGDSINADFFVLYGEDSNSLEKVLRQSFSGLQLVEYIDDSVVRVGKVYYDYGAKKLVAELFNDITEPVYARVYVTVPINLEQQTFKTGSVLTLSPGGPNKAEFELRLSRDVAESLNGAKALVQANYGKRQELLVKSLKEERVVEVIWPQDWLWLLLVIALILAAAYWYYRKRKQSESPSTERHYRHKR
ncbi:hypothetical protein H0N96_03505 [Candidatus Micrarchaeota archaeon]|nr:hypothetical protein [Candidatus Micrarchaeota archaeon]